MALSYAVEIQRNKDSDLYPCDTYILKGQDRQQTNKSNTDTVWPVLKNLTKQGKDLGGRVSREGVGGGEEGGGYPFNSWSSHIFNEQRIMHKLTWN